MGCQGAFYFISVFLLSMAYISSSLHGVLHTPSNLEQLSMLRKIDDILPKTFHSLYRTTCNLILYAFKKNLDLLVTCNRSSRTNFIILTQTLANTCFVIQTHSRDNWIDNCEATWLMNRKMPFPFRNTSVYWILVSKKFSRIFLITTDQNSNSEWCQVDKVG